MSLLTAGHEEAEHLERLIVKDFRNELKGHKERLQQSHRVRNMLDSMQERAKKLVRQDFRLANLYSHLCERGSKSIQTLQHSPVKPWAHVAMLLA